MFGEAFRIQCRRGNDELQIGTARQHLAQVTQQKIDIERALVRFVDDDGVVIFQQWIMMYLGQQDTVGHQLDAGVGRHLVVEAHLVADQPAQFRFQLVRDTRAHRTRRHSSWLSMSDHAEHPAPQAQTNFGQLRGLAGTGLAANNNDLMFFDGLRQFLAPRHHGQVGGIFDGGELLDARQTALSERR